jgi:hypothetical protein
MTGRDLGRNLANTDVGMRGTGYCAYPVAINAKPMATADVRNRKIIVRGHRHDVVVVVA